MLNWKKIKNFASKHRLAIAAAGSISIAIIIVSISPLFQKCVQGNDYKYTNQSFAQCAWIFIKSFWWCGGIFSKENGEAITGLATIVMAAFTGTLWWASSEQGKIAQRSIDLARDEFNAAHRPKIRIRHIWVRNIQPGKKLSVDIVYANVGDAKAIVKSFGLDFNFIKPGGRLPGGMNTEQPNAIEYAECGLGETVRRDAVTSKGELDLPRYINLTQETLDLYCFGIVEYSDAGPENTRKIKRTAFCRRYKKALEGEGLGRFVRLDDPDPDYEYED